MCERECTLLSQYGACVVVAAVCRNAATLSRVVQRGRRKGWGVAREPEDLVQMRRVLGGQLAAFREAAGLSQGQLAKATFRDRTSVAHIEKGRSRAEERFWKLVDDRCRAQGVLLAGFHAWEAARQDHEVRVREALLAEARAAAQAMRAVPTPPLVPETGQVDEPGSRAGATTTGVAEPAQVCSGTPQCPGWVGSLAAGVTAEGDDEAVGRLGKLLCGWVGAMNRRELLQLLGWATGTLATSPVVSGLNTDEQERLAYALASPNRVDQQVIDHIETIHRYCKQQDDALGARAVLDTVLAQQNLVQSLLADCPATRRPRLLSVYSNMSSSIAFYFFDLNEFDSAMRYGDQARAAAYDAGNTVLGIHALSCMSYFASWQRKIYAGLDFIAAARNLVSRAEDPLMRVCVAQRTATVYALDDQYGPCMAEFERAYNELASIDPVSVESPAYFYNEGFLASKKSECLLQLGKAEEAAVSARAGLATYDQSFVGSRAFCTLRLGQARLQSGEIDEAAQVVGTAAGLATQTRQARLVRELRMTRARMQPWQDAPAVKALDEQLTAYGLASVSAA